MVNNYFMVGYLVGILCLVIDSKITIQSPPSLRDYLENKYKSDNGTIPYSIANYGDVPYGKTITAKLIIPSVLEDCVLQDMPDVMKTNMFVIVERGDCTFVQKSLLVEKEGGKMAIIMDNKLESPGSIVMVDDGRGFSVHIPTILISKLDGQQMLKEIQNNKEVILSVSFDTYRKQNAQVSIWLDLTDRTNYIFIRKLSKYFERITTRDINFKTNPCPTCQLSDCFYNNSYCLTNINYFNVDNFGRLAIEQQLRSKIIFKTYPQLWWKYMLMYDDQCIDWDTSKECSSKVMANLGINSDQIMQKVKDSFQEKDNIILKQSEQMRRKNAVLYYPTININGIRYFGNLEPVDVFDMVCNSLDPIPSTCTTVKKQTSYGIWIGVGCGILLIFLIVLVVWYRRVVRRKLSKDINKQVNELVNQYITMYETDKFSQNPK